MPTTAELLKQSTEVAKKAAAMIGGTYEQGVGFIPSSKNTPASVGLVSTPSADDTALAAAEKEKTAAASMVPTPNESDRAAALAMFQAQIDALNNVRAEEKRKSVVLGQGRLGQGAAIQARRGLLGSDFGASQTGEINKANQEEQNAIDAKYNELVAAVYGKVNQASIDAANARVKAATEGADAKIAEIKGRQERAKTAGTNAIAAFLQENGGDVTKLTDQNIIDWANKLGLSTDTMVGIIKDAKASFDKSALETEKTKMGIAADRAAANKPIEVGGYIYKPDANGNYVNTGVKYDPKVSGTGGVAGTYVAGENPVVDAWAERIQNGSAKITDIPAAQAALRNSVTVALQAMGNSLDGKPTTTELGKGALADAKALMAKFNERTGTNAVGGSRFWGQGWLFSKMPGTDQYDFTNDFKSVKDKLSLEGVKYLKGQGSVSDAERALLAQAVTKLNLSQSESEFKSSLQTIIDKLEGHIPSATTDNAGESQFSVEAGGKTYSFPDQESLDKFKKAANIP